MQPPPPGEPAPGGVDASPELGRAASSALGWSFLNNMLGRLGTIGIGIVLARILGPQSFGAFAVATLALLALLSFNELGVSLAIVRWSDDPRDIAPTVNTVAVGMSVVLATSAFFAAPAFAAAMGDPAASPVIRLMLVGVLLDGVSSTPAALLQRGFKGRQRAGIDQLNLWLGAGISVLCAVLGLGAMSLAIGRVVGSTVSTTMFLISTPVPYRFALDRRYLPRLLRFGLPLAGTSILTFAIGFTDQLIVGSVLGTTALGYYVLAFNLASWPVTMFSQPLRSVAPAAFSRLQHDRAAMTGALRSTIGLLAALTAPICLALAGASGPVIRFVYGPAWSTSAHILIWLAVMAVLRIFFELSYDFLVVCGRGVAILAIQVLWIVTLIPALLVGAHRWGVVGVAAGQLAVGALIVVPAYLIQFRRVGLGIRLIAGRVWLPLTVAVGVGAIAWLAAAQLTPAFLVCVIAGLAGAGAVAALLRRDRGELARLRSLRAAGD